ncbi:MAG: glycogen debranching protein GlgX [Capsulimonadales bacterium]|nr:glycogen debranching protein GlgX [Capsulimonadales bacterium]
MARKAVSRNENEALIEPDETQPVTTVVLQEVESEYEIMPGRPHPLGATPDANGVNFSIFGEKATAVELLIFDEHDDLHPKMVIELDETRNKSFHFWHVYVKGLKPGAHYAFRVDGPHDPHNGFRYNRNKVLIDPYARGITNTLWDRSAACGPGDNIATSMRGVVIDIDDYDWEGDKPLNRPMSETIIYEMHVRGFTRSSTSGVANPGTFAGVIEKIPYLKSLGVTAVELLPVHDFDEKEIIRLSPIDGSPMPNYWGYSTVSFFAPHKGYCTTPEAGSHINEFRDMVKALHRAGIEVILDVVFNHTTEGNHQGPTINFRGLANHVYYILSPQDRQYYMDYSGCGNTVNANHPITEKMIIECLEYWVKEMHVDGFRFDEACILVRGEDGLPMMTPPVVWQIELSDALAETKIIAEAWDAAGLYQVGFFPGYRWAEWNGKYRDAIRRFIKGDPGLIGEVANRIAGSADLFEAAGELPINSINFITCHDGFCMADLVSYNYKHNFANGENNRDGIDDNLSWNCGVEGPTEDAWVNDLRRRQMKNFLLILMLSQGVPMLTAGDEVMRTQKGNNNPYCQDNEITWFDWTLTEKNADLLRFCSAVTHRRRNYNELHRPRFFTGKMNERGVPDISWHGCQLNAPGWGDPNGRVLAYTMAGFENDPDLHVMMNMHHEGLTFELPVISGRKWFRTVDTSLPSPHDIEEWGEEVEITGHSYFVNARSIVVLLSREA